MVGSVTRDNIISFLEDHDIYWDEEEQNFDSDEFKRQVPYILMDRATGAPPKFLEVDTTCMQVDHKTSIFKVYYIVGHNQTRFTFSSLCLDWEQFS